MSDLAGNNAVAALADLARDGGRLGIDTEFMGEGRYRTLLCLVQVAALSPDGGVHIEVLDPLDDTLDPSPLAAVLADPEVEIVMHAGRQDVALLRRVWQTDITNLFDTQLAAGFAGLRAQLGYEPLLYELLGVRLKKSASFTRWDARPLSAEQVDYARDDVRHILQAAIELQQRLRARGRLDWAREECVALASATDERDPDNIFARLPRVNSLDPKLRAIARELVVWREEIAQAQDRPIPSVLSDAGLIEVAKRRRIVDSLMPRICSSWRISLGRRLATSINPASDSTDGIGRSCVNAVSSRHSTSSRAIARSLGSSEFTRGRRAKMMSRSRSSVALASATHSSCAHSRRPRARRRSCSAVAACRMWRTSSRA